MVTILAALGGLLVILGGILGFLLSFGPDGAGPRLEGTLGALVFGVLAVIFGLIILAYSGFTHYRGVQRNVTGGFVLVVLGVLTWIVVGQWVLVAAGSFLTVMAGLVILAEIVLADPRVRVPPSA
ncbi:MAG: hypothetical protein L3J97_00025 [Thermoplasmata archaeon]|nr:hypothetical protein [Thermoplasmata archaeon]